jgi:hypothetical protein
MKPNAARSSSASSRPAAEAPASSPKPPPPVTGEHTADAPDERPRDDYEPDDPDERAGLRRPRGGTPNVPRT